METEPIRFYADEHVHPAVVEGLRRRGVTMLTCHENKMLGATDEAHLDFARTNSYVIFTQDDDFLRLHAQGATHAGIVYAHQRTPIGAVIQGLLLIQQVLTPQDMMNHIEFIS